MSVSYHWSPDEFRRHGHALVEWVAQETHTSIETHDARDAASLARVLREEVVRLYYDRDRDGLPREWIARMKRAIRTLGGRFSADRIVMDYVLKCYIPAAGGTSSAGRA